MISALINIKTEVNATTLVNRFVAFTYC